MSKSFGKEIIVEKLNSINIKYIDFEYKNLNQKIEYYCPNCNLLKEGKLSHIFNNHVLCKKCSGKAKRTQKEAEEELNINGIVYKNFEYKNNETIIEYQCLQCKKWKKSKFIDIIHGHNLCIECGLEKTKTKHLFTQKEAEEKLENLSIIYKPFNYLTSKTTNVEIKCKKCGNHFETIFDYIGNGGSLLCKRCSKSTSTQENELKEYIKSFNLEIKENIKINGVEIDCFIPELNIGFEFNGNYWHSDLQKPKNYHYDKITFFQELGIRCIMIWEHEWVNNNEYIKSYIKAQLGLCEKRIYARKCEVREITYNDCKELLNYHQQKQTTASNYIGLYYNNELVLAMLLQKPQTKLGIFKNKEMLTSWDIKREICKEGYSIVGGKSKVFKYFVNKYKPQQVISYVDRSKFTGKSYEIMGFKLEKVCGTRYDWVINGNFKKRTPSIYKKMMELYNDRKALRIYDSGRYKFVWKFN